LNESIVHPREIFKIAIKIGAVSIIISHNHPSGDPTPSNTDILTTKKLKSSGDIFGIAILDHIIVCSDSYYSFNEEGLL